MTESKYALFGRADAQVYGAYGDCRFHEWMDDNRDGEALFACGGLKGYTVYDNVRHTECVASHLVVFVALIAQSCHEVMHGLFGGRGSKLESLF